MKAAASMRIEGMGPLLKKLRGMDEKLARKGARQAIRAGAKPIVKAARTYVPVRTGTLKKAIGVRIRTYQKRTFVAIIGIRKGKDSVDEHGNPIRPRLYAHLVEFGTQRLSARPFLRRAIDSAGKAAEVAMAAKLRAFIASEARK